MLRHLGLQVSYAHMRWLSLEAIKHLAFSRWVWEFRQKGVTLFQSSTPLLYRRAPCYQQIFFVQIPKLNCDSASLNLK